MVARDMDELRSSWFFESRHIERSHIWFVFE